MSIQHHITGILLIGVENPIALSVIRALTGILPDTPIHTLSRTNGKLHSSRYSRHIRSHETFNGTTELEHLDELSSYVKSTGVNLLLPVDEYFVRLLGVHEQELKELVSLPPVPKPDVFDQLVHKQRLSEWLAEHDFPAAVTLSLATTNPESIGSEFFPCLLKPVRGTSGWGVTWIHDHEELHNKLEKVTPSEYILQEYIPGSDYGCSILAVNGEIRVHTIQKVLESNGFSFSTAIRLEHDQQILKQVQELVARTGYSGLSHLDFRVDERDGLPKLTDFNARFWNSILGSRAGGVDFVKLYCLSAMGIPFEHPPFKEGTYLMGKHSLIHYGKRILQPLSYPVETTSTDIWERITDPLPEIVRYL